MKSTQITAAGVVLLVLLVSVLVYRSSDTAQAARDQQAAAAALSSSPAGRDARHAIDSAVALNVPRIDHIAARSCQLVDTVRIPDVEPDPRYAEYRLRAMAIDAGGDAILTTDQRLRAPVPNADVYRCGR